MNLMQTWAGSILVGAVTLTSHGSDRSVFDERPYAEARDAAKKDEKWFIVKATAVWCGPCKQMDRTTWRDEQVVKWVHNNAVAVSVDVDKLPEIAKQLRIRAMPTIIAFDKEGREFDRVVGLQRPEEFRGWLNGIAEGRKSLDAAAEEAGGLEPGEKKVNVQARLNLARKLAEAGKADEAAKEYVWLWKNMLKHERSMYGVRLSFMVRDMTDLATEHEVARAMFAKLRDETGERLEGLRVSQDDAVDWVHLNEVLGEPDKTIAWYEKINADPRWSRIASRVEHDVTERLINLERWSDVGRLCRDPLGRLDEEHDRMKMMKSRPGGDVIPEEQWKVMLQHMEDSFRKRTANLYAGLLAAGRAKESTLYAARLRTLDPSEAMTIEMVRSAIAAKQPRQAHLRWLAGLTSEESKWMRERVTLALEQTPDATDKESESAPGANR